MFSGWYLSVLTQLLRAQVFWVGYVLTQIFLRTCFIYVLFRARCVYIYGTPLARTFSQSGICLDTALARS